MKTRVRSRRTRNALTIFVMLLPCFALLTIFVLIPLAQGIQLSTYAWDGVAPSMQWAGFDNYVLIWTDPRFIEALGRTFVWWLMHLGLAAGGALVIAALINEIRWRRVRTVFRSLAFLPNVLALSVVGVIWAQIYHPNIGLLNSTLDLIGLGGLSRAWLGEQSLALGAVGVASAWQAFGFYLVILLAGMQTIDRSLYESAMLDGAGSWARFRYITMPSLYNTISLVLVLALTGALKGFGTVWSMTEGGPANSTELAAVYVWRQAFQSGQVGLATAAGMSIALIAIVVTFATTWWRDRAAARS